MRYFCLFVFFFWSHPLWATEAHLEPFQSDGCTMFAEGTPQKPDLWKHCCVEHDLRYWFGGDSTDIDFADLQLKQCVQDVAGNFWAHLIYKGVREGHNSPVQHRFHWSWGWTPARTNTALLPHEKELIRKDLRNLNFDAASIENFIRKYHLN